MTIHSVRIKHLAQIPVVAGLNLPAEDGDPEWPRYIRTTDIDGLFVLKAEAERISPDLIGEYTVKRGDLLFSRTGSLGTVYAHRTDEAAAFAGYLVRVRPDPRRSSPLFLAYWASSADCQRQIAAGAIRSTIDNFNANKVANLVVPFVRLGKQHAIAEFLDRECARIDETLGALGELLSRAEQARAAHLEERLIALRSGWPLRKLAWDTSLLGGFAFKSEAFVHDPDAGVRLLRGTNVTPRGTRWDEIVYWPHERTHETMRFELRAGDLVVGLNRPWVRGGLRTAIIESSDLPALLLQRVGCIRPRAGVELNMRYLQLWMQTSHFRAEVRDDAAVTFPMLEPDRVLAYRVPAPPPEMQATLVQAAADRSTGVLALRSEIDKATSALTEYRDALITEAATGHLDMVKLSDTQMAERLAAVREGEQPEVLA